MKGENYREPNLRKVLFGDNNEWFFKRYYQANWQWIC
jgi:hypothetical protein